jgi:hypothetical protein
MGCDVESRKHKPTQTQSGAQKIKRDEKTSSTRVSDLAKSSGAIEAPL